MPLYDFICIHCGNTFEEFSCFETSSPPCPTCSSDNTHRVLSATHIKKGSMPFKPSPVHPTALNSMSSCHGGGCGSGKFS